MFKEEKVWDYELELINHEGGHIPVSWNASVYRDRARVKSQAYMLLCVTFP